MATTEAESVEFVLFHLVELADSSRWKAESSVGWKPGRELTSQGDCGKKDPKQWIIRQASTFWRNVGHLSRQTTFRKPGTSSN
jgi:hypothetical protein